jgi:hypothetical protein
LRPGSAPARNNIARTWPPTTGNSCAPYIGPEMPSGVRGDVAPSHAGTAGRSSRRANMMPVLPKREVGRHTPQDCSVLSSENTRSSTGTSALGGDERYSRPASKSWQQ